MTRLDFLCHLAQPLVKAYLEKKYSVHYKGKFPEGPCLIYSKHIGNMDQFFIGVMLYSQKKLATYIMRDFGILNYALRPIGGIMVVRSKDFAKTGYSRMEANQQNKRAADYALSRLKLKEPVVSFPEGTRSPGKIRTPFKLWVAEQILCAQENGAFEKPIPNVSVGLEIKELHGKTHVWVRAGEPFHARCKSELENKLLEEMPKLSNIQP
ncbi:MAG: 1-acyl-sn-glycerol-3-phosphate acyltransferase [Candidatus Woesearchaeota archaeon]